MPALPNIPPRVRAFLRKQQLYAAISVAVYAFLWALGQSSNAIVVVIYSFVLGNFSVSIIESLSDHFGHRPFPWNWIVFLALLLSLTPIAVMLATFTVGLALGLPLNQFWPAFVNGWKFPSFVTVLVGIIYNIYRNTQERLEHRNRELQRAIEVQTVERELQEQELQRAREIQQALLPKQIPQIAGLQVGATWEPATVVGGDYFDVIQLSPTKLGVCIADVVGKSVSAALLMASVQATVRAFASVALSPATLVTRVNGVLCNNIAPEKFVTFFYGVVDMERREFIYTNAGHLRPLLVRSGGSTELHEADGAVLGVFPAWKYEEASLPLGAGDRLVLFTDGVSEAGVTLGREFGECHLLTAVSSASHLDAAAFAAHLLHQAKHFAGVQLHDDATIVVIDVSS